MNKMSKIVKQAALRLRPRREMSGEEVLHTLVSAWNALPKPVNEKEINHCAKQVGGLNRKAVVDDSTLEFKRSLDILNDSEDAEPEMIGQLCKKVGEYLNLDSLYFLGGFLLGVHFLDDRNEPNAALEEYKNISHLAFDNAAQQYYWGNLGLVHSALMNWDESIDCYEQALKLADTENDLYSRGIYLQNKGVAHYGKNELQEALRDYTLSLEIAEQVGGDVHIRRRNLKAIKIEISRLKAGEKIFPPIIEKSKSPPNQSGPHSIRPKSYSSGDRFGDKYQIEGTMKGSMGVVYLLRNLCPAPKEPAFLCAKTFSDEFLGADIARRNFLREVESWLLLGRYEHIVWAFDYQEYEGQPYALIQHADGGSLVDKVESGFSPRESDEDMIYAAMFGFWLSLGMNRIHQILRVPHGDLTPSNVLFAQEGNLLKVSDFGIAAAGRGTPQRNLTNDIHSFGRVLWYMYTGRDDVPRDAKQEAPWLDKPISSLINDAVRAKSTNTWEYFRDASNRINDYVFEIGGRRFPTPEEHNEQFLETLRKSIINSDEPFFENVRTVTQQGKPLASTLINTGAAFSDLGNLDEAYSLFRKALFDLRGRGECNETRALWSNILALTDRTPDFDSRHSIMKESIAIWSGEIDEL